MNKVTIANLPELDYACNEALNTLATNISYCGENIRVIEITSRYAGEGKSFISVNLLRTFASLGKNVVLLDMDLRRSAIAARYQLQYDVEKPMGLAQYLAGMAEVTDIIYESNYEGAYLIPVGREVSNSLQLLASKRMQDLVTFLSENFDVVLLDTPPAGAIVDAIEVAKYCDGMVLVVSYNRGHRREISELAREIKRTGCQLLGVVLNNVQFKSYSNRKYYYRSERYYGYYRDKGYYAPSHGDGGSGDGKKKKKQKA